jgi:hypothetical protein
MKAEAAAPYAKDLIPDTAFLAERISYALDFAKRTIQHLIVDGHSAPEDASWYVRPEKIIAEAGLLMVYAKAGESHATVKEALHALYKVLEPLARSKAVLGNICLKPALALDYGCAHICLNYLGYPNALFDEALEQALESGKKTERTPYRMLEQAWLMKLWKQSDIQKEVELWSRLGCLNQAPDLFSESTDEVYATTHAAMYLFFDQPASVPIAVDALISSLESRLVIYMDKQDYDIAGELLQAWALTGRPFSKQALFSLKCLVEIEKKVGFLPAPNLDLDMIEGREQKEKRTYIYSVNYHTAFVMGLLCGSLLKHDESLRQEADGVPDDPELNALLKEELQTGKHAHWMEYYKALDDQQKEELLPWMYQVVLTRKIRDYEYEAVKKILDRAKGTGLEAMIITMQAQELLNRIGLVSRF